MENGRINHPRALSVNILVVNIIMSILGAIIGMELVSKLGVTPNTSIIGGLFAIILGKIPIKFLNGYKTLDGQNMVQTSISGATFAAGNAIILPMGILFLMERQDLIIPIMIGVFLAVCVDTWMIYKLFNTPMFPATEAWAPGIATAETLKAVAKKGKDAALLIYGIVGSVALTHIGIPMDLLGVSWIANQWAMGAFAVGLLCNQYLPKYGIELAAKYIPHGIMIGAAVVALIQISKALLKKEEGSDGTSMLGRVSAGAGTGNTKTILLKGYGLYILVAGFIAAACGLYTEMSVGMLILWLLFAALAAIISELIVGIAAMHAGWFPMFATTVIFLLMGLLIGFPVIPLACLTAFTAATGPAFSDMAYDLKTGWLLRGNGENNELEIFGRRQQFICELTGIVVAVIMVALSYKMYFSQGFIVPTNKAYVATILAGLDINVAKALLMWGVVGAVIQFIGGPSKQLGVMFATGLLISNKFGGFTILVALIIRAMVNKKYGEKGQHALYIIGAGSIAGSSLYGFFKNTLRTFLLSK
ncbi:MAG: OPT/YSL family transporter [Clostridiaceae bacterium]|jgi:uncharacterized oligopeptide transporter (OPT) family protein|nr:OPT/YSL family transporter [Clostridiaceae bacterium]